MKSFKNYIACLAILALFFNSCSKDDENGSDSGSEKAVISFGAILNDLVANRSALKQQLNSIPECSNDLPVFIEVVLSREGAAIVGTMNAPLRVNVNPNPGDSDGDGQDEYFTDESASLQLEPGIYSLEYFKVLNEGLEVIWIAPVQDGQNQNFSGFVDNPLPIEINLRAGTKKYVNVEVLCFDNRFVNNYGYLFFEFEGTEALKFCIFGNYCDETGRHAEAVRYIVNVWNYSGNANAPRGEVLYENMESGIVIEDDFENGISTIYSVPLCFALPDKAGLDEYYFEITLLSGAGYNVEDQLIRQGVITDEDVRSLYVGDANLDYYHFREGSCNLEDSPLLFEENGSVLPSLIDLTTEENANLTLTTIEIRGDVVGGNSPLINAGVIWGENPNPTLDGDSYYEYEAPFLNILSGMNPGQTYYYKLYAVTAAGTVFSEEKSFTTLPLVGTTWDFQFLHYQNDEVTWHADITFYEDGTAFYTEPAAPGVYDIWSTWSIEENILTYNLYGNDTQPEYYVLTGMLEGNDMSGTYTFGERNPSWVAVKYD